MSRHRPITVFFVLGSKSPKRGPGTPTLLTPYYFVLSIPLVEEHSVNLEWCNPLATANALSLAMGRKRET